jgi:hypothetical protein
VAKKAARKNSDTLLGKLREEGETSATRALARLIVDEHLHKPLSELIQTEQSSAALHEVLCSWQQSDLAHESIRRGWDGLISWLEEQHEPIGAVLPAEILEGASQLAAQPFGLNRELLLAMLDRPAFRKLIRELLVDTLVSFGKKLRNPVADSRLGKGLSGIGRMARGRGSGVRGLAGDLVGAVGEEVERQLEGRATDFADGALSQILHKLADYLCEPARAADQAALRAALLDGLWELSGAQLAAEMSQGDIDASTDVIRRSLGAWLQRPGARKDLDDWLSGLLSGSEFDSLAELLTTLGLLESIREHAIAETERNLRMIIGGEAFPLWISEVAPS